MLSNRPWEHEGHPAFYSMFVYKALPLRGIINSALLTTVRPRTDPRASFFILEGA